ncbi:META domain-containing protein [Winogradskyella sp. HB-48]|uniref:META domain-containing protein n=1 Tax=Winogradskyella sp. HB-48 TaxID=3416808 RepID=UPI003CF9A035
MKNLYYFIFIFTLISFNASSQSDLIGTWYLDSFTISGGTYKNVYNYVSSIEFTEDTYLADELEYNGGSTCNYYFGGYSVTNNTITFFDLGSSGADCYNLVSGEFEDLYFSILSNNFTYNTIFNYIIEGNGNNQTLMLTKSNGDNIIYSKTNPNSILHNTWYLQSITESGITLNISSTDSPSLTLDVNIDYFSGSIPFSGSGDCNDFTGAYNMYFGNGDELSISSFVPTSNICDPPSDFEDSFFSILSNDETNQFNFEIINNGNNLVLTSIPNVGGRSINLTETSLTFSQQALSIDEYDENQYYISLLRNPVEDKLILNLENQILSENIEYTIYSIEGKQVKSSILNSDSINIEDMVSGVYFISFVSEDSSAKTLKFIKK